EHTRTRHQGGGGGVVGGRTHAGSKWPSTASIMMGMGFSARRNVPPVFRKLVYAFTTMLVAASCVALLSGQPRYLFAAFRTAAAELYPWPERRSLSMCHHRE